MDQYINVPFAIALLIACAWTTMFSRTIKPGIRGYRNLGILSSYVMPLVFLVLGGWKQVLTTWTLFGIAGGIIYILWEILQRLRSTSDNKPGISPSHLVYGLVAWPIMVPEAIEYILAESKILRA